MAISLFFHFIFFVFHGFLSKIINVNVTVANEVRGARIFVFFDKDFPTFVNAKFHAGEAMVEVVPG